MSMTKDQVRSTEEALRLALEALENSVDLVRQDAYNAEELYGNYPARQGKVRGLKILADDHEKAITAIKAALLSRSDGEAKDEPVAWVNIDDLYDLEAGEDGDVPYVVRGNEQPKNMPKAVPLYTTPPQRKPLTDEEIMDALKLKSCDGYRAIVRAIEAAHGIKGET